MRDGSGPRRIAPGLDRSIHQLEWAADGRSIIAAYEENGSVVVSRIGLDGRVTPISSEVGGGSLDRPYAGGGFSLAAAAPSLSPSTAPPDRPTWPCHHGGKTRQLTRLNELTLSGKSLGTLRKIKVERA